MLTKYFPALGYIQDTISDDLLPNVRENVDQILNDFSLGKKSPLLPGNIKHEYVIDDEKSLEEVSSLVIPYVREYVKVWPNSCRTAIRSVHSDVILDFSLDEVWVNFQREGEIIPPHINNGLYSFVIWLDIPYDRRKLRETDFGVSSLNNMAGDFLFYVTNSNGENLMKPVICSKEYNNTLLIFPSNITHTDYQFKRTSENESLYKVSLAGTVSLKPSEED